MSSCRECLHYDACRDVASTIGAFAFFQFVSRDEVCDHYHAKDAVIYLPCSIGATLYEVTPNANIWERHVEGYHLNTTGKKKGAYLIINDGMGLHSRINVNKLGNTVFYTEEDAEAAIRGRQAKGGVQHDT